MFGSYPLINYFSIGALTPGVVGNYSTPGTKYSSGVDPASQAKDSFDKWFQTGANVDWSGEGGYPGAPKPETIGNQKSGKNINNIPLPEASDTIKSGNDDPGGAGNVAVRTNTQVQNSMKSEWWQVNSVRLVFLVIGIILIGLAAKAIITPYASKAALAAV